MKSTKHVSEQMSTNSRLSRVEDYVVAGKQVHIGD